MPLESGTRLGSYEGDLATSGPTWDAERAPLIRRET
jgi:hypothetical protein